jgi:glycosyltransferase involved in cell wall biosynthesis
MDEAANPNPTVSVIVPAHNAERYLRESLDSVLAQTFTDFELIVIDDGSTDRTAEILRSYGNRIVCVHQEKRGPAAARNRGLQMARGSWIAFQDSDDIWLPQKLERQAGFARAHPQYGIVTTDILWFDETGVTRPSIRDRFPIENGWVMKKLLLHNWISNSAVMARRECFERVGGFDEEPGVYGSDWMKWVEIAQFYQVYFIEEVLVRFRRHAASFTQQNTERQFENLFRNLEKLQQRVPALAQEPELVKEAAYRICVSRGSADLRGLHIQRAREKLRRALHYRPYGARAWLWLIAAHVPASLLHFARKLTKRMRKQA